MKTSSWLSKSIKTMAALALAAAAFACVDTAKAVVFDYSSTVNSFIVFPGDTTFNMSPSTNNFMVTSGTAAGLLGDSNGTFTIGTITINGNTESAPVTGTGSFVIHDGSFNLTATLTWVDITQVGTGGNLNISGQANLSNITYGGTNADLVALRNAGSGGDVLSFQFIPAVPLTQLRNGPGPNQTSFSGTVASIPDGGSAVALLGIALAGIEGVRRMFRARKS